MSVTPFRSRVAKNTSVSPIRRASGGAGPTKFAADATSGIVAAPDAIGFCSRCGTRVEIRILLDDHLPRHVCPACSSVQYRNPRIIVGLIPETTDGRVVMCRRAIAPRQGFWTFPAGHLENGETGEQGATREAEEEAGIRAEAQGLYMVMHVLPAQEVHLIYRGQIRTSSFAPGPESAEVRIVGEDDMPWAELAYPAIETCLRRYFADRAGGRFPVHSMHVFDGPAVQGGGSSGSWHQPLSFHQAMQPHVD